MKGSVSIIVILALALLGGGAYASKKFGWFSGETKRASTSTATTEALVKATDAQGSAAAAYVAKIGEANSSAPESPQKDFIGRAVPITLGYLPAPDPKVLLEAEKLKNAVLTGKLAEADNLAQVALSRAGEYQRTTERALAAKRASDVALQEAAEKARQAEADRFLFMCVAGALGLLWLYTKLTHTSPWALAKAVTDMRSGTGETNLGIVALDSATTPLQQGMVKAHAWFLSKLSKLTQ